jgi:hypothetical protein
MTRKLAFDEKDHELIVYFVRGMERFARFIHYPGKEDAVLRIENAYCKALVQFTEETDIVLSPLKEAG